MTQSRRVTVAFAVSVLLHLVFFTVLALTPEAPPSPSQPLQPDNNKSEEPLEITLQQATPTPAPIPVKVVPEIPEQREALVTRLDPAKLKKADKAPENASWIAAHHSVATKPKQRQHHAADRGVTMMELSAPLGHKQAPPPSLPKPTPIPQARPNPQFRTAMPRPTPVPVEAISKLAPAIPAAAARPTPAIPEDDDDGSDDEAGIAAIGEWKKAVGNAIGSGWNFYRESKLDLLVVGSVRIKFAIDAKGRVSDVQTLSNTANATNALYAVRSVMEAEIPPIPPERLARLQSGHVAVEFTFTILPNP